MDDFAENVGIDDDVIRLYTLVDTAMANMPDTFYSDNEEQRMAEMARTREMLNRTCWEPVWEWLVAHPNPTDRRRAAMHRGQFLWTALHVACKLPDPPAGVVRDLIECAEETASWPDANGWLPLHHAVANGASGRALGALVRAYPEGKVVQDKRFRTPLHFAWNRREVCDDAGSSLVEVVKLLADSGAAKLQDEAGMLPMHYASAYGATREVLEVLFENYPESIAMRENKGRNCLHLAMVNAHRVLSPKTIEFLLEKSAAEIVNSYDADGRNPIDMLFLVMEKNTKDRLKRKNTADCLKLYLDAKPKLAMAHFLTTIHSLPDWLRDVAIGNDHFHDVLNHKISTRFSTMILILDFAFRILVIVMFELASGRTIDWLFSASDDSLPDKQPSEKGHIITTLVCGVYFLLRELVQISSLTVLGKFNSWRRDIRNWFDVLLILLIFFFGAVMLEGNPMMGKEAFRAGAAITKGVMWISVITFLASTRVGFAVFTSGIVYVVRKEETFTLVLVIGVLLLAFSQMFYILFARTDECECNLLNPDAAPFPHCDFPESLMKVYTMLMGEIGNEFRYAMLPAAQFLYIVFAFLAVILVSPLLIAIITDAYAVIKDERAAMVFWSNRLNFLAEVDAIKNGGRVLAKGFCSSEGADGLPTRLQGTEFVPIHDGRGQSTSRLRDGWEIIMNLFDRRLYETYDVQPCSVDFWSYHLVRIVAVFVVVPAWLVLGLCTAGWLWPPQVREYLFNQKEGTVTRADLAGQIAAQVDDVKNELKKLGAEVKCEITSDREEFARVKADVVAAQT